MVSWALEKPVSSTTPMGLSYAVLLCLYFSEFCFILEQLPVPIRKYLEIPGNILNDINDL